MTARSAGLSAFFQPSSIAILGASSDERKIGGRPVRYLLSAGYRGRLLPVNPGHSTIQGLRAYPSIDALEEVPELAIVCVPGAQVLDTAQAIFAKGTRAAIVFSAGFAEAGAAGEAAQRKLVAMAHGSGSRVLGPNCIGLINARAGVYATFTGGVISPGASDKGSLGLASQSGAFAAHCLVLARRRGMAFSLWGTTGNESDVDVSELIQYMAEDAETKVVLACIEGVRDGARLVAALAAAELAGKPIILMKIGSSAVGAAAAASHTASLAGSDAVFDSVVREFGVHRAHSIDELFDLAYVFSRQPLPGNDRMGVLTVSGGVGIILADEADAQGFEMPSLPEATQARLKKLVPYAGTRNPLDVTAQLINDPGLVKPMFEAIASDGNFGTVVAFLSHIGLDPVLMPRMLPALESVAKDFADRVLIVSLLADSAVREQIEAFGYCVFEDPNRGVRAAAALRDHGVFVRKSRPANAVSVASQPAPRVSVGKRYNEMQAKDLLASAGIPVTRDVLATTAAAAVAAAVAAGFPVAMKIVSSDIAHKSEVGGVFLDLPDEAGVERAFHAMMASVGAAAPGAAIDGVSVTAMARSGVELIVGCHQDPVFGAIVMVGLGGIFAEIMRDVAMRRAPFTPADAEHMVRQLKGFALLDGARGKLPCDLPGLCDSLAALSRLAAENADEIATIEINPLRVYPAGEGVLALDALIVNVSHSDSHAL